MEIIADITTCNGHVTRTSDEVTYVIHLLSLPVGFITLDKKINSARF
jgi:hypothetical protein